MAGRRERQRIRRHAITESILMKELAMMTENSPEPRKSPLYWLTLALIFAAFFAVVLS